MLSELDQQLLTHHALGELPPGRLPEVERLLAGDPAATAWVAGVRATAAELAGALAAEAAAAPGLDPVRRAVVSRAAGQASAPRRRFRAWMVAGGGLAAAALALGLLLPGPAAAHRTAPPAAHQTLPPQGDPQVIATRPVVAPAPPPELLRPPVVLVDEAAEGLVAGREERGRPTATSDLAAAEPARPPAPGREDAVSSTDRGGAGAFTAIGDGGGSAGMFGSRGEPPQRWAAPAAAGPVASAPPPQPPVAGLPVDRGGETYARHPEPAFRDPRVAPLSTFGLDIDTAAYANVRRFLEQGSLPPPEAVRIEEMLNAFAYDDAPPPPDAGRPFAVRAELAACPWAPGHRLARIAVRAIDVPRGERPPCNLVFLIDVSGSMGEPKKLVLVQRAMAILAGQLRADDRVAVVTYSDSARLVLPSTPGSERGTIIAAVDALRAGGSTNGAAGIQLAYRTAQENAVAGVNRVILCTDGDFNLGASSPRELQELIAEKRRSGVTLTALGFGMGNLKDANLQVLADRGNGTYAYIDSEAEARTALAAQLDRHLVMVAKDAKVQVEFNPARVAAWRLIGYEKRLLRAQDFADDRVDSGDVGAGAHVVALYELVPRAGEAAAAEEGLRYPQPAVAAPEERWEAEVMFVKLRWKRPDLDRSELVRFPVLDRGEGWRSGSTDFRFAAAVAAFGMALRDSPDRGDASLGMAAELAGNALGEDRDGKRAEFVRLVQRARELAPGR